MDARHWLVSLGIAASALAAEALAQEEKSETASTAESAEEAVPAPPTPADLAARALEIEAREAALREVERSVRAQIEELRTLRQEALAVLEPERQQREDEIKKLVAFYQNMKPKNAANLIEELPLDLATAVLSRMKTREAGKILNVMGSKRAVQISQAIAGPLP
jgi:flagellar motility protein MotE (MotC chaperone)